MNANLLPSDECAIIGVIDPDAYTAAAYSTSWLQTGDFRRLQAIVMAGDLGSSATINAKLERASDSSGTGAEDITNAAITALTQAGSDDNKQAIINYDMQHEEGNAKEFIRLTVTVGTATSDMGALLLGFLPFHGPASDTDASTVDEIVNA